eukprot:jgi/Chrpa1/28065/Chrysochromulina_OHIO_Genome00010463-RA
MKALLTAAVALVVPVMLLGLRRVGVVKGLGLPELAGIGVLMHVPYLLEPALAVTISVALNITLILRIQELQEEASTMSGTMPTGDQQTVSAAIAYPAAAPPVAAPHAAAAASDALAANAPGLIARLQEAAPGLIARLQEAGAISAAEAANLFGRLLSAASAPPEAAAAAAAAPVAPAASAAPAAPRPPMSPAVAPPAPVPASPALPAPERRATQDGASSVKLPKLSAAELSSVAAGELVLKAIATDKGNEGLAVQRVQAPADLVWATILDFGEWPRMVDDVVASAVYDKQGCDIKVKITIGVGLLKIHTYVHHVLDRVAGVLTWSLDATKSSDLLANTGYWIVRPHDLNSCTVYYSCNVQLRSWAPGWLDRYIAREGLPRALGWLKREAEERVAAAPPALGKQISIRPSSSSPDLAALAFLDPSGGLHGGLPGGLERRHSGKRPSLSKVPTPGRRLSTERREERLSTEAADSSPVARRPPVTVSTATLSTAAGVGILPVGMLAASTPSTSPHPLRRESSASDNFSLGPLATCGLLEAGVQALRRRQGAHTGDSLAHRRTRSELNLRQLDYSDFHEVS